jgi:hypothetical protein
MRMIVRQSILLEEHLAESAKYCQPCIVKHFQHIIGLAEEAIWMAGGKLKTYPYLEDSATFYSARFDTWVAARKDPDVILSVLDALRARRREMIEAYFLA